MQRGARSVTILVMLALLTLVALVAVVFYWTRRRSKKRSVGAAEKVSGVDGWVAREVSAIVAQKLALAKDEVARSFGGDPDPDMVSAVERAVAKVELVFEKLAGGETEMRAEVAFEDGTAQKATRSVGWSELPDDVRAELARTGASRVHRAWALPWAS